MLYKLRLDAGQQATTTHAEVVTNYQRELKRSERTTSAKANVTLKRKFYYIFVKPSEPYGLCSCRVIVIELREKFATPGSRIKII